MARHLTTTPSTVETSTDVSPTDVSPTDRDSTVVRRTLRLNGIVSSTSGIAMAVAPATIDDLLGTGHPTWIRIVGLALVAFGVGVAALSTRPVPQLRAVTPLIIAADVLWVAASVATIALGWYDPVGALAVAAMALAVAGFACGQFIGWRRLEPPRR